MIAGWRAGTSQHLSLSVSVAVPRCMPPAGTCTQIVTGAPKFNSILLTHCGQLIRRKFSKFSATRCQLFCVGSSADFAVAVTSCRLITWTASFFGDYWYFLWLNWRTFRLWTMLKQLLNGNTGLLLILTLNNTDWVCDSVTAKKCDCNFSVKIKVPNFKTKFSGHFKNSVKFVNFTNV